MRIMKIKDGHGILCTLVAIVCYGMVNYTVIVLAPYNPAPHYATVGVTLVVIILPNICY